MRDQGSHPEAKLQKQQDSSEPHDSGQTSGQFAVHLYSSRQSTFRSTCSAGALPGPDREHTKIILLPVCTVTTAAEAMCIRCRRGGVNGILVQSLPLFSQEQSVLS